MYLEESAALNTSSLYGCPKLFRNREEQNFSINIFLDFFKKSAFLLVYRTTIFLGRLVDWNREEKTSRICRLTNVINKTWQSKEQYRWYIIYKTELGMKNFKERSNLDIFFPYHENQIYTEKQLN